MRGTKLLAFNEAGERFGLGSRVTSFRGETGYLVGLDAPGITGKSGKVTVRMWNDNGTWLDLHNYDRVWGLRVAWLPDIAPDAREDYWLRVAKAARELQSQLTTWAPGPQDTPLYREQYPHHVEARLDILEDTLKGWSA